MNSLVQQRFYQGTQTTHHAPWRAQLILKEEGLGGWDGGRIWDFGVPSMFRMCCPQVPNYAPNLFTKFPIVPPRCSQQHHILPPYPLPKILLLLPTWLDQRERLHNFLYGGSVHSLSFLFTAQSMRPITQKEKITLNTFPTTCLISTGNKHSHFLFLAKLIQISCQKPFFSQKRVAKFRPVFSFFRGSMSPQTCLQAGYTLNGPVQNCGQLSGNLCGLVGLPLQN